MAKKKTKKIKEKKIKLGKSKETAREKMIGNISVTDMMLTCCLIIKKLLPF